MRKILWLMIVAFAVVSPACKQKGDQPAATSELDYGGLPVDRRLIGLEPGALIILCGSLGQKLQEKIQAWGDLIGRNFKYQLDPECNKEGRPQRLIVTRNWDEEGELVTRQCPEILENSPDATTCNINGGYFSPGAGCLAKPVNAKVVLMSNVPENLKKNYTVDFYLHVEVCYKYPTVDASLLHEGGHMWGLCDQYSYDEATKKTERIAMHHYCDQVYRSEAAAPSIMNLSSDVRPTHLTIDDTTGIRVMACRKDIPANAVWLQQLGAKAWTWNWRQLGDEFNRIGRDLFLTGCLSRADAEKDMLDPPR